MRSWNAKGLVELAWKRLDDPRRDELARITGIEPGNLSSYNSGKRPLTIRQARKIAAASGMNIVELGAPEDLADDEGSQILDRLRVLERQMKLVLATLGLPESVEAEALAEKAAAAGEGLDGPLPRSRPAESTKR